MFFPEGTTDQSKAILSVIYWDVMLREAKSLSSTLNHVVSDGTRDVSKAGFIFCISLQRLLHMTVNVVERTFYFSSKKVTAPVSRV
jgi:hypothetical protein